MANRSTAIAAAGMLVMTGGLLHLPFLDDDGREAMAQSGSILEPADFPQILVCVREIATLDQKLARIRRHLFRAKCLTAMGRRRSWSLRVRRT